MTKLYCNTPEVKSLIEAAFPCSASRNIAVLAFSGQMILSSYWDGGCRDYWSFVNLETFRAKQVPENGTPFSNGGKVFRCGRLPLNIALVLRHRGMANYITVYVHPDNLNRLALPLPVDLTSDEKIVLFFTRSRKSSHNGRSRAQMAADDAGITGQEWDAAKSNLIARGMLNKAGAITDAGRNAIGDASELSVRKPGWDRLSRKFKSMAA